MLQAIRSKATSLIVKLLFGALILSFGVWGIGDIFRNRGVDNTVATVGDRKIELQALNQEVHQSLDQLRAMFRGAPIDFEQLKQHGFVEEVLQRLVDRELVDLEASRLGLAVGSSTVLDAIRADPANHNAEGAFDPQIFKARLAQTHQSEGQLQASMSSDLVRGQLVSAVISGAAPPAQLVDALYRLRAERRVAETVTLPETAVPAPAAPTDADLASAYDRHKAAFRVPELRSFTAALLLVDDVAAQTKPSDEKMHEEYQARLSEFTTPERRRLQQILLPDEAKAKEATALLTAGKDFAEVAKEVAGVAPDKLDLDFFTRDQLPQKLGDAVFALKLNETTEPIQDELGWHILRVTDIQPEAVQPFDQVKDKLAAELARDSAGDQIAKMANSIDDKIAGGANFDEVVQSFGLKTARVENVDANGRDAEGKTVELPQPSADILRTAFGTDAGQISELTEMGESGYVLIQMDKVTPETFKPLDQVRAQVVAFAEADQREAALEKLASDITDQVNGGGNLETIAAQHKLAATTSKPLQRSGGDSAVPPAIVAKVFEAKPGTAVYARGNDGYVVAVVKEVLPPDPAQASAEQAKVTQQLTPALQQDLFQEYDKALRERYPVTVNTDALARVL